MGETPYKSRRVPNGIVYEEMRGLLTDSGVILRAQYRSTVMHLVDGVDDDGPWLSIWSMTSGVEGRGDCQAMIAQLRVEWPDHALYGSVPISPAALHIFRKHHIRFTMNDAVFESFRARSGP